MTLNSLELRQYAMKPGRRDELITLFERELVESQRMAGFHKAYCSMRRRKDKEHPR